MNMNRREHLKSLIGLAALPLLPQTAARTAQNAPVPPEGIGHKIRHLAYSDIGGRPDSVQIMLNRRHLYVGHMFSNGLTILDASDPRRPKPVGFFTGGDYTRTHHLKSPKIFCCSPTAPISWQCSRTTICADTLKMRWPTASPIVRNSAPASAFMTFLIRRR